MILPVRIDRGVLSTRVVGALREAPLHGRSLKEISRTLRTGGARTRGRPFSSLSRLRVRKKEKAHAKARRRKEGGAGEQENGLGGFFIPQKPWRLRVRKKKRLTRRRKDAKRERQGDWRAGLGAFLFPKNLGGFASETYRNPPQQGMMNSGKQLRQKGLLT